MIRPIELVWIVFLIGACSTVATTQQKTVATVSATEATLAAAGRSAVACMATPVCSAPALKAQIKAAYDKAYNAVTTAQAVADAGGTPDMTAATAAIVALQNLIPAGA
jgi:hypothetical protein